MLTVKEMYDYHTWTNRQIITRLKKLPNDLYQKDVKSVFSRISTQYLQMDYG
jgi:uncharacterized damage-inducible protein DinB